MTTLAILEHPSAGYKPRTIRNADISDITLAFAADFTTGGEVLTRKVSGSSKYFAVPLNGFESVQQALEVSEFIASRVPPGRAIVVNIAGNGIHTLSKHGWDQVLINKAVFALLKNLPAFINICKLVCGGQTGSDLAGAVAGVALNIPVEVTMPKGCRYRDVDGIDRYTSPEMMEYVIRTQAAKLV